MQLSVNGLDAAFAAAPAYALAAFDGAAYGDWLSDTLSSLDPTKKGSLTYNTAAGLVGEKNLQTAAQLGRAARDAALKRIAASKTGGATALPVDANYAPITPDTVAGASQMLLVGSVALLGLAVVLKMKKKKGRR